MSISRTSRHQEEAYSGLDPAKADTAPTCAVAGCKAPVVAKVDDRFFVCQGHLEHDPRMKGRQWQWLLF